jgi:hypothetical protein
VSQAWRAADEVSAARHAARKGMTAMAQRETCGNDYDKSFQVVMNGAAHTFDCGHGLESEGTVYCWRPLRDSRRRQRAARSRLIAGGSR